MEDRYLYFPVSGKDESWGLTVLNVGSTNIKKGTPYPPAGHPAHYQFNWETGRVLQEYQLIYIRSGSGIFESGNYRTQITEGSVILLYPNEHHRYRPDENTGWEEIWVGFRGDFIDNIISKGYFSPNEPVFYVGSNETIASLFEGIVQDSVQEQPGYQPATSGALIHLLGVLHARRQQSSLSEIDLGEKMVTLARVIFRESLHQSISPEAVAEQLQVGYSRFRKVFKKFTGLAPGQYLIQLKIQKAKEMLADPARQIKEIAYDLNLESPVYFSKLFKAKTGISPLAYRKKLSGNNHAE